MKLLNFIAATVAATLIFSNCAAQKMSNAKTEAVKIYGNCGMCEKTIEKAAAQKGIAKADWDKDTKIAKLTYDSAATNAEEVLKRIAAAGYDSEKFRAPDEVYASLPGCCQYERPEKMAMAAAPTAPNVAPAKPMPTQPAPAAPTGMTKKTATTETAAPANPLADVYAAYFSLKDALVASDGGAAAAHAKALFKAVDNVKMDALAADQHKVWMKYQQKLSYDAEHIKGVTDLDHQREHFVALSENMAAVMKTAPPDGETYLAHCPMANDGKGADWLSREKGIKNPYYGKAMLTCGKVTETLKN